MQGKMEANKSQLLYAQFHTLAKNSRTNLGYRLTPRDIELLTAIDRHPMTTDQLLNVSQTFSDPFRHSQLLRRRLGCLRQNGLLQSWPLATASQGGSPHYWKLTRDGYRLLYGEDSLLPKRRYFESIALGHHHHTHALGEFLTHLLLTAAQNGVTVQHFARENSVQLKSDAGVCWPDCAFQLINRDKRRFYFVVELDNGTERVRSKQDVESIERKMRSYIGHQAQFSSQDPDRYLVLFVTTRSQQRVEHILDLAADLLDKSQRTVFLGVNLAVFLAGRPFRGSLFTDHRGRKRKLIPPHITLPKRQIHRRMAS